jgi:2'-5' RNA ligase
MDTTLPPSDAPQASAPSPRLFIAYTLPSPTVSALAEWQSHAVEARSGVRALGREQLHVTMVFLGRRSTESVAAVAEVIRSCVAEARSPIFRVGAYRETSRVGMLTLREDVLPGDHYVFRAGELVGRLMRELESRGLYRREHRSWTPHVTVCRFREPPRLSPVLPALAPFRPPAVVLCESVLSPSGSVYRTLAAALVPD